MSVSMCVVHCVGMAGAWQGQGMGMTLARHGPGSNMVYMAWKFVGMAWA